jgi:hypothetical protein
LSDSAVGSSGGSNASGKVSKAAASLKLSTLNVCFGLNFTPYSNPLAVFAYSLSSKYTFAMPYDDVPSALNGITRRYGVSPNTFRRILLRISLSFYSLSGVMVGMSHTNRTLSTPSSS